MNKVANFIVLSLVILSALLSSLSCKTDDVASYGVDEITGLAKNLSPDCPAPTGGGG